MKRPSREPELALPQRLVDSPGHSGEQIRRVLNARRLADEQRSWDGLVQYFASEEARGGRGVEYAAVAGTLFALVALWLGSKDPFDGPAHPRGEERPRASVVTRAAAAPRAAPKTALTPGVRIAAAPLVRVAHLGRSPVSLPASNIDLEGAARVQVSGDGVALAWMRDTGAVVQLVAGQIDLHVVKQVGGHRFQVLAEPYQFVALGTTFRVERTARTVRLSVTEGSVAVARRGERLAIVAAGSDWEGPRWIVGRAAAAAGAQGATSPPATAPALAPAPEAARASSLAPPVVANAVTSPVGPPAPSCADEASQDPGKAVRCYETAGNGGLRSEIALYEAGRLRRDALGDASGALAAFREYRRRFPTGVLRDEVNLSIIEILPKLGRYREALVESERLLEERPEVERKSELRSLRGNIYREALHDCARAEHEYAAAVAAGGGNTSDAEFWRAVCLEQDGRTAEAAAVYRAYLDRRFAPRADEARRRLAALPVNIRREVDSKKPNDLQGGHR